MQNAYASQGGYLDLAGFDVSATQPVIARIHQAVTAADVQRVVKEYLIEARETRLFIQPGQAAPGKN